MVDERALQSMARADRFARLEERQRVKREIQYLVEYYEAQITTIRKRGLPNGQS